MMRNTLNRTESIADRRDVITQPPIVQAQGAKQVLT
jgi:hypothetical protein